MKVNKKYKEATFHRSSDNTLTESAGKMLAQFYKKNGQEAILKESFNFKEDVNLTTGSGAYTTLLSSVMQTAVIEDDRMKEILDLVNINNDMVKGSGFGAYKIPRLQPTIAVEVAEGSVVNYFDEGVDSITVTPRKVVVGTALTWEMMKRGMNDFVKMVMTNAADAIKRKLSSDIVNGLAAGANAATTGGLTFANVLTSEAVVNDATYGNGTPYGFMADKLVMSPTNYASWSLDTDVKSAMHYRNANPNEVISIVGPVTRMFSNMSLVITPFLTYTGALALVLDSKKAAILVKESEIETFEGSLPGRPYDHEIVALQSYVLAIVFSKAINKITA